ncbi:MAG: hypothetical protein WC344_05320 [Bacilli bacterium]|jgi:hypothetical protein
MERNKIFAIFLVGILTIGGIIAFRTFADQNSLFDVSADKKMYASTLSVDDGPGFSAPKIGMIDTDIVTCYYSTNSDLSDSSFLILSATDAKTPGVFMNLTVINGLQSVNVTFSGGTLYAMATETCFEDYTPTSGDELVSGNTKVFGRSKDGYLMIMTNSYTGITISSITVNYYCDNEVDDQFVYSPDINYHVGSRSSAQDIYLEHDAIRFQTNPTETTNNYSSGTYDGHPNYWYRFNGVTPRNYALIDETKDYSLTPKGTFTSNTFEVIVSVMVDPSVFYNPTAYYCVSPWIGLATSSHEKFPDAGNNYIWMQSYIGNDNHDPIGGVNLLGRTDTYTGRFFTNYAYEGGGYTGNWGFQNPDEAFVIGDPATSLREAYETINLPFFNVRFAVNLNSYSVYINGFKVYEEFDAFYLAENYSTLDPQQYCLETFELQAVNYGDGVDSDGDGPDTIATPIMPGGYGVAYTNPIVRTVIS